MHYLLLAFALPLSLVPVLAQTDSSLLSNVTQAFSQAQIVPDLLPSFTPDILLNVTFPADSTNPQADVTPGTLLPENQTATEPAYTLITNDTGSSETFLIVVVDPDVPSPLDSNRTQFLHFLGGNFSLLGSSSSNLFNQTPALFEFFPPTPPAGSPPHRYVVLVYDQPDNFSALSSTVINASTPRMGFDLAMFTTATNLTSPIAGNYFLVGPDNNALKGTTSSASSSSSVAGPTPTLLSIAQPNSPLSTTIKIISSTVSTPVATPTIPNGAITLAGNFSLMTILVVALKLACEIVVV